jgi:mannose-6-phosphate isomerase
MHTLHEKVWGSTKLSPWYPDSPNKIGEVWFDAPPDVPLLVKFLFTTENLSVQVHPEDAYAREHHNGSNGKTEMWHILRADPGARIALGLNQSLTASRLREASVSGEIMDLLNWIEVKPGDTYFTPARTIHAIGAGVALCEIQQISDITYRLYDYGRPREMHLDHGVAVSNLEAYAPADINTCPYFRTKLVEATANVELQTPEPSILICLQGSGQLDGAAAYSLGEAWHIANSSVRIDPAEPSRFLLTHVPPRYS